MHSEILLARMVDHLDHAKCDVTRELEAYKGLGLTLFEIDELKA